MMKNKRFLLNGFSVLGFLIILNCSVKAGEEIEENNHRYSKIIIKNDKDSKDMPFTCVSQKDKKENKSIIFTVPGYENLFNEEGAMYR